MHASVGFAQARPNKRKCAGKHGDRLLFSHLAPALSQLVGEPKFHSLGRCTMAVTNMHSDKMSIAFSGLAFFMYLYGC